MFQISIFPSIFVEVILLLSKSLAPKADANSLWYPHSFLFWFIECFPSFMLKKLVSFDWKFSKVFYLLMPLNLRQYTLSILKVIKIWLIFLVLLNRITFEVVSFRVSLSLTWASAPHRIHSFLLIKFIIWI